jgi:hypothetical protein
MLSNKKVISYEVVDLVEIYNFDINFFYSTLFEKVMNFIVLQHGYHRRIMQQAGSVHR